MKATVVKALQKSRKKLLENWMQFQLADDGLREDLLSNEDLREQSEELLNAFVNGLTEENIDNPTDPAFDPVLDTLAGISISRARQGFSPRETGAYVISLKDALLRVLQDEYKSDPATYVGVSSRLLKLMDSLIMHTFETYIKGREEVILRQTDELAEISTPVIRVWEGILALPIIGTLDSSRTQVVMETLLEQIVQTESVIAILDISGVPAVDSLVAQHIIKTVSATRLMGADCIISGIRPEIAQTVVHLGIDLNNIVTKATLASALKYAFNALRLEVKRQEKVKSA